MPDYNFSGQRSAGSATPVNGSSALQPDMPAANAARIQIQKEPGGLALILQGKWDQSRPLVENYLAALGDKGVATGCDLEHGKAFSVPGGGLSTGAAAATIDLDPARLRANGFAGLHAILNGVDEQLGLSGPTREFSLTNIMEQTANALKLKNSEYEAAFGKGMTKEKLASLVETNRQPAGVRVLDFDFATGRGDYNRPVSEPKIAAHPPAQAPEASGMSAAGRWQKIAQDRQIKLDTKNGTPRVLINIDGNDGSVSDMLRPNDAVDNLVKALKKSGLEYDTKGVATYSSTIPVTLKSEADQKALMEILKTQGMAPSPERTFEIRQAVYNNQNFFQKMFSSAPKPEEAAPAVTSAPAAKPATGAGTPIDISTRQPLTPAPTVTTTPAPAPTPTPTSTPTTPVTTGSDKTGTSLNATGTGGLAGRVGGALAAAGAVQSATSAYKDFKAGDYTGGVVETGLTLLNGGAAAASLLPSGAASGLLGKAAPVAAVIGGVYQVAHADGKDNKAEAAVSTLVTTTTAGATAAVLPGIGAAAAAGGTAAVVGTVLAPVAVAAATGYVASKEIHAMKEERHAAEHGVAALAGRIEQTGSRHADTAEASRTVFKEGVAGPSAAPSTADFGMLRTREVREEKAAGASTDLANLATPEGRAHLDQLEKQLTAEVAGDRKIETTQTLAQKILPSWAQSIDPKTVHATADAAEATAALQQLAELRADLDRYNTSRTAGSASRAVGGPAIAAVDVKQAFTAAAPVGSSPSTVPVMLLAAQTPRAPALTR